MKALKFFLVPIYFFLLVFAGSTARLDRDVSGGLHQGEFPENKSYGTISINSGATHRFVSLLNRNVAADFRINPRRFSTFRFSDSYFADGLNPFIVSPCKSTFYYSFLDGIRNGIIYSSDLPIRFRSLLI